MGNKEGQRKREIMEVKAILYHSKNSTKNKRERGRCHFMDYGTGKTKDPVRVERGETKSAIPHAMPEKVPLWCNHRYPMDQEIRGYPEKTFGKK